MMQSPRSSRFQWAIAVDLASIILRSNAFEVDLRRFDIPGGLALSKKYEDYADCHQQYADPPLRIHALIEENNPSECPRDIAQRGHRNDKADVINRKSAEQPKKGQSTHSHPRPHPRLAQRSQNHS